MFVLVNPCSFVLSWTFRGFLNNFIIILFYSCFIILIGIWMLQHFHVCWLNEFASLESKSNLNILCKYRIFKSVYSKRVVCTCAKTYLRNNSPPTLSYHVINNLLSCQTVPTPVPPAVSGSAFFGTKKEN